MLLRFVASLINLLVFSIYLGLEIPLYLAVIPRRKRSIGKETNKLINGAAKRSDRRKSRPSGSPSASPFPFHFNFSLPETQIFVGTFILRRSGYEQNEENYRRPARLFARQ